MNKNLSLRSDFFTSIIDHRIVKFIKDEPPVNVDKMVAWGVETTITAKLATLGGAFDLSGSLGHAFVHARYTDYDPSLAAIKGPVVEFTPEHHFNADLFVEFTSGISIETWAVFLLNQKIYVMDHRPTDTNAPYSTSYFTTVNLHNPFLWNFKTSFSFAKYYKAIFTVMNILDDYNANPFNPGPGRRFYISISARWE